MKLARQGILFFILFTSCIFSFGQKRPLNKTISSKWLSFSWYSDSVSGRWFDKLAVMLPVRVNNIKARFTAQFDLGSSETILYGNVLKHYFPGQPALYSLLDTTRRATSDAGVVNYPSRKIDLHIGNYITRDLLFFENYGDEVPRDSLFTTSEKHIGTIGATFTNDKVLIIDFPRNRMCILDTMTKYWSSKADFVDCRIKNNRIHLPLTINGKLHWIMFDTGASIFPLSTGKKMWESMVDTTEKPDTLLVNSWGEKVPYYGATMRNDIYLGSYKLPAGKAWYNENERLLDFNKGEGIDGTTGNAYFFQNTIIIDFKNKRFGILKNNL